MLSKDASACETVRWIRSRRVCGGKDGLVGYSVAAQRVEISGLGLLSGQRMSCAVALSHSLQRY